MHTNQFILRHCFAVLLRYAHAGKIPCQSNNVEQFLPKIANGNTFFLLSPSSLLRFFFFKEKHLSLSIFSFS